MVTKQQLDDCIENVSTYLTAKLKSKLDECISNINDTIIETYWMKNFN